jgi:hypothetical protein
VSYEAPILPAEVTDEVTYSPEAVAHSQELLSQPVRDVFHALINGYESDAVLPACQTLAERLLRSEGVGRFPAVPCPPVLEASTTLADLLEGRDALRRGVKQLHQQVWDAPLESPLRERLVLLHQSPAGLTEPCWLDNVSQPATQPARVVNDLFRIYGGRLGNGDPSQSASVRFQTLCAQHDVFLPGATSSELARHDDIADSAYLAPCYHLAVGRHPRLFLPEILGTTLAHYTLHMHPLSGEFDTERAWRQCGEVLRTLERLSLSPRWPRLERRIVAGFKLEAGLAWHSWQALGHVLEARCHEGPRERMCKLVQRVARFAGEHHHAVTFEGRPLAEWLADAEREPSAFVDALGRSSYIDRAQPANSKFLELLRIDGPMFAIFSRADGKVIKEWVQSLAHGEARSPSARGSMRASPSAPQPLPTVHAPVVLGAHRVRAGAAGDMSLRELFHSLINVDLHPYILPLARRHAEEVLRRGERYLVDGRGARYSDATFFEYTPAALEKRMEDVYFDKLLRGYRPLEEMPPRALVVTMQTMLALGSLIDGAWIHKMGKAPQYGNRAASLMFGIYADEMGYGDMRLNHIMVARRVLDSMDVDLPEMAERDYAYHDAVPEKCYAFLAYQLAISQFPQSFFAEGLGLNLAVEMFGLGQVRLDEIRKLNHYGFDDSYERLHLTIDNVFSGHVRVGVQAIHSYLDEVRVRDGREGVERAWRRVWLGYASMAQFVE